MSNLIQDYDRSWFNSKFAGAMFFHKGVASRVVEATRSGVLTDLVVRHDGKIKEVRVTLPYDEFKTSDKFQAPDLGYRHMMNGKVLVFII